MDLTWMMRLEGAVRPWHEGAEDILCALAFEHGRLLGENARLTAELAETKRELERARMSGWRRG